MLCSGWVARRNDYPKLFHKANATSAVFWGHGQEDDKVPFSTAEVGRDLLKKMLLGAGQFTFRSYEGMGHSSCEDELADLQKWLDDKLPQTYMLPELWDQFNIAADADSKKAVGNDHFKVSAVGVAT